VICQRHAPAALPSGKEPLVSIRLEAGWGTQRAWKRWQREQFPAPAGNRTPVVTLTELSRLLLTCLSSVSCSAQFLSWGEKLWTLASRSEH
jgi:hypothetical protein